MLPFLAAMLAGVAACDAARADSVALDNGDVLRGRILQQEGGRVVLDHDVLGRVVLPADRVAATARGDAPLPGPPALPDAGLLGTGLLAGWDRSLELGVSGSEGNTESFDGVAGLRLESEDAARRWRLDARYFHSSADEETTKSQGRARLLRDWLLPGRRLFAFAEGRYDFDRFEPWDHRVSVGAGPGYELLRRDDLELRARTGLFVTRTFGAPGRDEIAPEAAFGGEVAWRPDPRHEVTARNMLFVDLRNAGELRNVTAAAWKVLVAEEQGLSLQVGVDNEWESEVEPGERKNDLTYHGSLVVDF